MKRSLTPFGRTAQVLLASFVVALLSIDAAAIDATDIADGYTSTAVPKEKFGAAKTLNPWPGSNVPKSSIYSPAPRASLLVQDRWKTWHP